MFTGLRQYCKHSVKKRKHVIHLSYSLLCIFHSARINLIYSFCLSNSPLHHFGKLHNSFFTHLYLNAKKGIGKSFSVDKSSRNCYSKDSYKHLYAMIGLSDQRMVTAAESAFAKRGISIGLHSGFIPKANVCALCASDRQLCSAVACS